MARELRDPEPPPAHGAGTCIRCRNAEAPEPLGLCPTCSVQLRVELTSGLRRLGEYLGRWAAFDEWCRAHGAGSATVG